MADKAKRQGGKRIGYWLRKNPLKTKDAVPYLADVVPTGTANLDMILSEVAESLNITKARVRLCYDAMFELIHAELAKGNKVQTRSGLGEAFAVSGQGFSDAVEVTLVDKKGVRHEVAVEEAKETLLLCGGVSAAAKGAATLEASVASSSCATGRFTATRRVKVC